MYASKDLGVILKGFFSFFPHFMLCYALPNATIMKLHEAAIILWVAGPFPGVRELVETQGAQSLLDPPPQHPTVPRCRK